jgi:hypothetical protein
MQQSRSNKNSPSKGAKSKSRRDTVLSFREGHVFMALRMVSPFDQDNGTYLDPIPRITFLVDGKYVRMPVDKNLLKRFGSFMVKLSELLEGIEIPEQELDFEEAKKVISEYNGRRSQVSLSEVNNHSFMEIS